MAEWIYGRRTVTEHLLAVPATCLRLLMARGSKVPADLTAAAELAGVTVEWVDRQRCDELTRGGSHQGVCLRVGGWSYTPLADLLAVTSARLPLLIALDCVQDPRNLGAVLRVADGLGAQGVLIPRDRAAGLNATVARTAAGAVASVPVAREVNLARALDLCREAGFWILGAADAASEDLYDSSATLPCVLCLGGEEKGLRQNVARRCDHTVAVPMGGQLSSLNLAVACGVIGYELRRRHLQGRGADGQP